MFAIPCQLLFYHQQTMPPHALVKIGSLVDNVNIFVKFDGVHQTSIFIKYVIMFALVGTLESLLTLKAIDLLDPFKRKSNVNKDIIAVGIGNSLAAVLGGLPMISEVARSSSNVHNGAKTRWANFFHGFFILIFVLFATPFLEMIPNAALAAMLISVGIKLAHPSEFKALYQIGKEQLLIFVVTIVITLYKDLLVGIAAGILINFIIHFYNGAPFKSFFKSTLNVSFTNHIYQVKVTESAIFSNYLGIKSQLDNIPKGHQIIIDLNEVKLIDHSVMKNLEQFITDYELKNPNGKVDLFGLEHFKPFSEHPLASRKHL